MIVAATACLDENGMRCCQELRIQEKNAVVEITLLKDIAKVCVFIFKM